MLQEIKTYLFTCDYCGCESQTTVVGSPPIPDNWRWVSLKDQSSPSGFAVDYRQLYCQPCYEQTYD